MSTPTDETVAAVDLGSNSFHMIVAQVVSGRLQVVDRMKEMVRLAAGFDENKRLNEEAVTRALGCLERFGERLRGIAPGRVRAVGTNTLRKARNTGGFLAQARAMLGHRIDIISGAEEARLIYLGVSHSLEDDGDRRLVVDIGGGSTELILGQHFQPHYLESLYMGCVGMSQAHFPDGAIDRGRMRAARLASRRELAHIEAFYKYKGWDSAIGASGTILSIRDVVINHGWSKDGITPDSLNELVAAMVQAGHVDALQLEGLQTERAPVFPGGVAILQAVFEGLALERMRVASGALREGLLYDLLGRAFAQDVRDRTVETLAERYRVDLEQVARVQATGELLFDRVAEDWRLSVEEHSKLLKWSAALHEIGLQISHSQYHKHGGYLLSHLDMPGFARGEQRQLAALVRGHRRKFPREDFESLPADIVDSMIRLCVVLRLAVVLHRGRSDGEFKAPDLSIQNSTLKLRFPPEWLDQHPLTRADLEQEATFLKPAGVKLKFK